MGLDGGWVWLDREWMWLDGGWVGLDGEWVGVGLMSGKFLEWVTGELICVGGLTGGWVWLIGF